MSGPWTEDQASHLHLLFYSEGELGICGCGNPDAVYDTVLDLLNAVDRFDDDGSRLRETLGPNAGVRHLVMSALDRVGLTEHGGSVWGSWLTPKGRAARRLLSLGTPGQMDEQLDEFGYPHGGDQCPGMACWAAWDPGEDENDG